MKKRLEAHGWSFDKKTGNWVPPKQQKQDNYTELKDEN